MLKGRKAKRLQGQMTTRAYDIPEVVRKRLRIMNNQEKQGKV